MRAKKLTYASMGLVLILSGMFQSGCSSKSDHTPAAQGPGQEMIIPVVGFRARQQPVSDKISLVGTLEANEIVEIKSEIDGTIEEIDFEEGQKVNKGDVLILIDQKKLQATLAQAESNLKLSEATLQRYQSLIESGAVSHQEYDQAVANHEFHQASVNLTQEQLHDSKITAPFDGVMGERLVSVGQYISQGTIITSIVNHDPIKAHFRVPERYLSQVKEGQNVEMQVAAYPGEKFTGEVYFIDPKIDELTRTALLKARFPNTDGRLRHGMFASLQLIVKIKDNAIVIPETALMTKSDTVQVYVISDERAVIRVVNPGTRLPGFVEIVDGIAKDEIVVVEGHQKLFPGVKVALRYDDEMGEGPGSPSSSPLPVEDNQ